MHPKKGHRMKEWKEITHYAGFDWARDHHAVVIVNSQGEIVADFEFEHSLEGWNKFRVKLALAEGRLGTRLSWNERAIDS